MPMSKLLVRKLLRLSDLPHDTTRSEQSQHIANGTARTDALKTSHCPRTMGGNDVRDETDEGLELKPPLYRS
jgi:hypothetical protein